MKQLLLSNIPFYISVLIWIFFITKYFYSSKKQQKFKCSSTRISIANSANLPNKYIDIKTSFESPKYQAVYLIQYINYDYEKCIFYQGDTRNFDYPVQSYLNCDYVLVDTENTDVIPGSKLVIEDNYSKAILIVAPNNEYFYLDVIHPSNNSNSYSDIRNDLKNMIHYNKKTNLPQITREELKYYRVIGALVAAVKDGFYSHENNMLRDKRIRSLGV